MTQTPSPSEYEAALDNVDLVLEAITRARQLLQRNRRRAVPTDAPGRPGAQPDQPADEAHDVDAGGADDRARPEPPSDAIGGPAAGTTGAMPGTVDEIARNVEEMTARADRLVFDAERMEDVDGGEAASARMRAEADALYQQIGEIEDQHGPALDAWYAVDEPAPGTPGPGSEVRLPLDASGGSEISPEERERLEGYINGLGATLEDDEIVIPVDVHGAGEAVDVDPRVMAWREVTTSELRAAAGGEEQFMHLSYLAGTPDPDTGAVAVDGQVPARIVPTERGLQLQRGVQRGELDAALQAEVAGHYGGTFDPRDGTMWFDVTDNPHADPGYVIGDGELRVAAARAAAFQAATLTEVQSVARADRAIAPQDAIDLAEKHREDGTLEAMVWVDGHQQPTSHPDGVPSVWLDESEKVVAFGHYQDGQPEGAWAWTDPDTHSYATDWAVLSGGTPQAGTAQHRDQVGDSWSSPAPTESTWARDLPSVSGPAEAQGPAGELAPRRSDPRRDGPTPPMGPAAGPSPQGPSLR